MVGVAKRGKCLFTGHDWHVYMVIFVLPNADQEYLEEYGKVCIRCGTFK